MPLPSPMGISLLGLRGGVFLSTDNGTTWTAVNNGLTNSSYIAFAVSGRISLPGRRAASFSLPTTVHAGRRRVPGCLSDLSAPLPSAAQICLLEPIRAGVFISTDNGTIWNGTGFLNPEVWSLAVSDTNLFAGTYWGVFHSTNNGTSWTDWNAGFADICLCPCRLQREYLCWDSYRRLSIHKQRHKLDSSE